MAQPKSQTSPTTWENSEAKFDELFDNGMKVTNAFLHQALHVPGLPAERTINDTKLGKDLQMSWTPSGLLIKAKGKRVTIPPANVATCSH